MQSRFLRICPEIPRLPHHPPMQPNLGRKRVAIVGSGVSGIGALYALRNTHHDVHLFEAADRLGGHTNTCTWTSPDGKECPVDTGFIVLNTATYRTSLACASVIKSYSTKPNTDTRVLRRHANSKLYPLPQRAQRQSRRH